VPNSDELWADIRATTTHLAGLSVHLRDAAAEARRGAGAQQKRSDQLRLESLENLKKLADQVREILWRELRISANLASQSDSGTRAAELFALLTRMGAAQERDTPSRSFFEEIEGTVERALTHGENADCRVFHQHSDAA
jgi:hypothetical protein